MMVTEFSSRLLRWYDQYGRKDLPWQHPRSPYQVWLSEIMLQQTQVKMVLPYFARFMQRFPDPVSLANAPSDEVMALWSGLGYYSRARNLHKTAQIIRDQYQGVFPDTFSHLTRLPGIGATTAAAICSQAFDQPVAILDANVKRVLSRLYRIDGTSAAGQKRLWETAQRNMPSERCAEYTQAIMDFGALYCRSKNPLCGQCTFRKVCAANRNNQVGDYPRKKIKKKRPIRESHLLLIHGGQKVYLVKNPPEGIWGGLWTLPGRPAEIDYGTNAPALTALQSKEKSLYTTIRHSFSHFHLTLYIWQLEVSKTDATHPAACPNDSGVLDGAYVYREQNAKNKEEGEQLQTSNIIAEVTQPLAVPEKQQDPEKINLINKTQGRWIGVAELSDIGLPGPIQKILNDFLACQDSNNAGDAVK